MASWTTSTEPPNTSHLMLEDNSGDCVYLTSDTVDYESAAIGLKLKFGDDIKVFVYDSSACPSCSDDSSLSYKEVLGVFSSQEQVDAFLQSDES